MICQIENDCNLIPLKHFAGEFKNKIIFYFLDNTYSKQKEKTDTSSQ
jgi:hypothetical protein